MNLRHISLCGLLLTSVLAFGDDFTERLVLDAINNNQEIKSSQAQRVADIYSLKVENNLDDPEIEFGHKWGNRGAGNKLSLGISQSFEWPGLYKARKQAIAGKFNVGVWEWFKEQNSLELKVRNTIVEIKALMQARDVVKRVSDNFDRMLETANEQRQSNNITILDLNKIRIETAKAKASLNEVETQLVETQRTLSYLLNSEDIDLEKIEATFDLVELNPLDKYISCIKGNLDIKQAQLNVTAAAADLTVANRSALPKFSIGYEYEREDGGDFHGFNIGLSIPLFSIRYKKQQAQQALIAAQINETATQMEIENKVRNFYDKAVGLKGQIDIYGPSIAVSDNLSLLNRSYELRQINLTNFLLDYNYFLEAELTYIELQRQYLIAVNELNALTYPMDIFKSQLIKDAHIY